MTRAGWVACAAGATCVLMACGGTEDGRDYRIADAGARADDAGAIADAGLEKDASQIPSGEGSGSSAPSGSGSGTSSGTATCEPGGACGGLYYCNDDCYSDKCCQLSCSCSDPTGQTGTLECSLTSCEH